MPVCDKAGTSIVIIEHDVDAGFGQLCRLAIMGRTIGRASRGQPSAGDTHWEISYNYCIIVSLNTSA